MNKYAKKYIELWERFRTPLGVFLILYGIFHLISSILFSWAFHWVIPGNIILGFILILFGPKEIEATIRRILNKQCTK